MKGQALHAKLTSGRLIKEEDGGVGQKLRRDVQTLALAPRDAWTGQHLVSHYDPPPKYTNNFRLSWALPWRTFDD